MIAAEKASNPGFSVALALAGAGLSESGYYAQKRRQVARRPCLEQRQTMLCDEIVAVFEWSNRRYGYRRVHAHLLRQGINVSQRTVASIFAELGLKSVHPAPWRHLTEQDGSRPSADLISRNFAASELRLRLVGDITQIDTTTGPVYLATVIDLFNREIVQVGSRGPSPRRTCLRRYRNGETQRASETPRRVSLRPRVGIHLTQIS